MDFDLDRFHAGDEGLFAQLVTTYSPRLLPRLRRYAISDADAHDLLQEVWLRVYAKRRTFDGRGSFPGWLLAIGRTIGIGSVRKASREPGTEELHELAAPGDAESPFMRDALSDAVLALPERQRDVVMLRLVEGLSTAETANRLGCAEGTVKATLHQATRKLREYLKEHVP